MVFVTQAVNTKTDLDRVGILRYQNGMSSATRNRQKSKNFQGPNHIAAHREAAGLSQGELGEKMGTTQNQISRLETGTRGLKLGWLQRFSIALQKPVAELLEPPSSPTVNQLSEPPQKPFEPASEALLVSAPNAGVANDPQPKSSRRRIDVLGRAAGGREGKFILNGEKQGYIFAPPSVEASSNPYALYVFGTSMEPRYEDGEMVIANPDVPYHKGSYVVVQLITKEEGVFECYVKRFISFGKELVLEQLNPPKGHDALMRFPRNRVHAIHKLVGPDGK